MTNVVDTTPTERIVWLFNKRTTEIGRRGTSQLTVLCRTVRLLAIFDLIVATLGHVVGLLHKSINCVIDSFDAIRIIDSKLRIVWSLNLLIDDTIDYSESIHFDLDARNRAIFDGLVLLVEIVVKPWPVMTAVTEMVSKNPQFDAIGTYTSRSKD